MLRDFWTYNDLINSHFCPVEIPEDVPCVVIVDNDDFKSDTLTGEATSAHRTNVMFVQPGSLEVKPDENSDRSIGKEVIASTIDQVCDDYNKLSAYKATERKNIPTRQKPTLPTQYNNNTSYQRTKVVIHTLLREDQSGGRPEPAAQKTPSFSGFQASMEEPMVHSKAYYHHTYPLPPSKIVCFDIMFKLSKMIKEKNIPFAVLVGDYPVYAFFLELKTAHPELFANIIPHLAPFHMQMSFLAAINKRFMGSGLSEVLVAAGVIKDGSVDQAMKGKHFNRAIRCHSLMRETLIGFLLKEHDFKLTDDEKRKITALRDSTDSKNLKNIFNELAEMILTKVQVMFTEAKDSTELARFWISYLDMIDTLFMNVDAQDWNNFLSSMYLMLPWMKIYDNDKYARLLPDHWAFLSTLPEDQLKFFSNHFAQSMTGNPHSGIPLDMWIECTMNKKSKSKSGWHHILKNKKQLMVNIHHANHFGRIREKIHRHSHLKKRKSKHKDCAPTRIVKDERAVQDLHECCLEFQCNPFDKDNGKLRSLQSSLEAPQKLVTDLESAHEDGLKQIEGFMEDRVYSNNISIYNTMSRNSRLNFTKTRTIKEKSLCVSMKEMETEGLGAVVALLDDNSLADVFKYRITSECLAIFNANSTFRKCQKSKLVQCMNTNTADKLQDYTAIIDMGMIIRKAIPNQEQRVKGDGTLFSWEDYINNCVSIIFARHSKASTIICVNDPYGNTASIKYEERQRRSNGEKIANTHMKLSDKFPSNIELNKILKNDYNKSRLQVFLKDCLKRRRDEKVRLLYSLENCIDLGNDTDIPELYCNQAEADTIMLTIYHYVRTLLNDSKPVVIDAEDADIYVQAAYVARKMPGLKIYKGKEKSFVDCRSLCSRQMADVIIQLHVMTGCDSNSAFFGIGKMKMFNKVVKSEEARNLLKLCGESEKITDSTIEKLCTFVIKYIYNDSKSNDLTEARVSKWKSFKKKKSLARLPPEKDSLIQHITRANYLAYIQLNNSLRSHPSPIGNGWILQNGTCFAQRHTKDKLPTDVIVEDADSVCSDAESNDDSSSEESSSSDDDSSSDEENDE